MGLSCLTLEILASEFESGGLRRRQSHYKTGADGQGIVERGWEATCYASEVKRHVYCFQYIQYQKPRRSTYHTACPLAGETPRTTVSVR